MERSVILQSIATAEPPRRYTQREIYDALARTWDSYRNPRIRDIFLGSDIEARRLWVDIGAFDGNESIGDMHARFAEGARELGGAAIRAALERAGTAPGEVDFLAVATCTGYLCPGLTAIYARDLGLPDDLERADLVGMGCAGALPAIQRACDYAAAHPGSTAVAATVEVCSACYYVDDTLETAIGNAICGDGAAAVVVRTAGSGPEAARGAGPLLPRFAGFRTLLDTGHIGRVGFQNRDGRLRIVLAKELRDCAGALVRRLADHMLADRGLTLGDVAHWVLHPGGRKIIDAVRAALEIAPGRLRASAEVLSEYGNMSSPTVLFVLDRVLAAGTNGAMPKPGDLGVMIAMGPGLAVEGALLQW